MSVWEDVLEKKENVDADANATRIIGVGMVSSYPRQEVCVFLSHVLPEVFLLYDLIDCRLSLHNTWGKRKGENNTHKCQVV